MVTLTRDDFEKLYISRAAYDELNAKVAALQTALDAAINMNIEKNAEVVRLTAALAAANEDSARLAIVAADGSCCVLHDRWLNLMIDEDEHATDCPITLHRARVGGAS